MLRMIFLASIVVLIQVVVVTLMLPVSGIALAAEREQDVLADVLGDVRAHRLGESAKATFDSWFVDSGAVNESFKWFIPTETQRHQSKNVEHLGGGVFNYVGSRLAAMWNLVFLGLERFMAFSVWAPVMAPLLIAAWFDGVTMRRVKLITFSQFSAPRYGASMRLLVVLAFAPVVYALLPCVVTPIVVPVWFLILALAVHGVFANLQRL